MKDASPKCLYVLKLLCILRHLVHNKRLAYTNIDISYHMEVKKKRYVFRTCDNTKNIQTRQSTENYHLKLMLWKLSVFTKLIALNFR